MMNQDDIESKVWPNSQSRAIYEPKWPDEPLEFERFFTRNDYVHMASCSSSGNIKAKAVLIGAIVVVVILLLLPTLSTVTENYPHDRCSVNLSQMAKAIQMYRQDYRAYPPLRNPDFFTALYRSGIMIETRSYRCPSSEEEDPSSYQFHTQDPNVTDYECRTQALDEKFSPALMLWEKKQFHEGGRNVVLGYFNSARRKWEGKWDLMPQRLFPEAKFQELVKEARK